MGISNRCKRCGVLFSVKLAEFREYCPTCERNQKETYNNNRTKETIKQLNAEKERYKRALELIVEDSFDNSKEYLQEKARKVLREGGENA